VGGPTVDEGGVSGSAVGHVGGVRGGGGDVGGPTADEGGVSGSAVGHVGGVRGGSGDVGGPTADEGGVSGRENWRDLGKHARREDGCSWRVERGGWE